MSARDDARDAGLLLRYALDHTVNPARDDTYSLLLDRYHTDPDLRTAFDEVAVGLGVRALAVDRSTGLVLTASSDSPLAVTDTSRWLRIRSAADRMVYGVALGGVAAWCYPNARSVREPGTRRVTAVDVDRLVREHAAAVESGDIGLDGGLGEAWQEYAHNRKQVAETATGRLKLDCTVRMCEDVLAMLATFGLVVVDKTVAPPRPDLKVWRSTDRFRAHVAASGGPLAWQTIAHSGKSDEVVLGQTDDEEDE
jgi:hypothetical protein